MTENAFKKVEAVTSLGETLKSKHILSLDERFSDVKKDTRLVIATPLDPRFKKVYIIDEVARNIIASYFPDASQDDSNKENVEEEKNQNGFWSRHLEYLSNMNQKQNSYGSISHFDEYLRSPLFARKENIMKFWKNYHKDSLRKIAIKYLSIIETSAPSERLCSKTAQVLDEKRNRLKPKNVQNYTFLNFLDKKIWDIL